MTKLFTSHRPKPAAKAAAQAAPAPKPDTGQVPGPAKTAPDKAREIGGPEGPEPTRYGDWERKGICVDF